MKPRMGASLLVISRRVCVLVLMIGNISMISVKLIIMEGHMTAIPSWQNTCITKRGMLIIYLIPL